MTCYPHLLYVWHRGYVHNKWHTTTPPSSLIELITPAFLETLFINLFFQKKKRTGSNQAWTGMVCNHTCTMAQTMTVCKSKASDYKKYSLMCHNYAFLFIWPTVSQCKSLILRYATHEIWFSWNCSEHSCNHSQNIRD